MRLNPYTARISSHIYTSETPDTVTAEEKVLTVMQATGTAPMTSPVEGTPEMTETDALGIGNQAVYAGTDQRIALSCKCLETFSRGLLQILRNFNVI